jgi:predicted lipid-binding transport protein (Tim44 family)
MSTAARFPAGFDADGFLRGAKQNFVRLQLANDRGDLEEIREITTPELFESLQDDVRARVGKQETDITALDAQLLDLATENGQYWASVGFSGTERERPGAQAVQFSEVWNLVKPVDGSSGWLLAGIQQMH